jgi:hypothetical protein
MHDDQFTAKGPVFSGSGFKLSGFSTNEDGDGFQFGVRVNASRCGVVGQTGQGGIAGVCGQGRFSQFGVLGTAFQNRTGVVGVSVDNTNDLFNLNTQPGQFRLESLGSGRGIGVLGKSGSGFGVQGISETNTAIFGTSGTGFGVHGISETSTAVVGASREGFGVDGISETNTGVHGASGTGLGVHGSSDTATAVFGAGRAGFGVHGISESNAAVVGESSDGDGVVGRSSTGHGGTFESGRAGSIVGQIHLVPQRMPVTTLVPTTTSVYDTGVLDLLPPEGRGGDLLVTQNDDGECVLWICTRSSQPPQRATWRQVLLGDPVATSPTSQHRQFVDWSAAVGDRATGTLFGADVNLSGPIGTGSSTDATFRGYDTESFEPRLAASDCIEIIGGSGHTFTVTFAAPVKDPIFLLASFGSVITFTPGIAVTRLSGDEGFSVDGATATGTVAGTQDSNGVIHLQGTFTDITFSAVTNLSTPGIADGIFLQIGASRPT